MIHGIIFRVVGRVLVSRYKVGRGAISRRIWGGGAISQR